MLAAQVIVPLLTLLRVQDSEYWWQFFIRVVTISVIVSHKFHSIPSLTLFTLTDDPQFYGLEVSLNNILMVDLFRSNNRMIIFSKTEKNYIIFLCLNKRCIVHFCRWRGLWRGLQMQGLQMEWVMGHTIAHII